MKKYNILFYTYLFASFLFTNTIVSGQDTDWDFEERNVISIYWTTLSQKEKKIYLFSYMTQVYETYDALKKEIGYEEITQWYYENKAETVFGIFDQLEEVDLIEYIGWIDEYYSHKEFQNNSFMDALVFAFSVSRSLLKTKSKN
jgi:hypothetical protein